MFYPRGDSQVSLGRALLHHDRAFHPGMDGADVGIGSGLGKSKREFVVGIQSLGSDGFVSADDVVRDLAFIGPSDLCPDRDRDCRRREREIINLDFGAAG